ncbi:MAG: ATP-binding cassette domain-containing protein [Ignavibacteria bacterium]|nr:ATP-binding cassette domain-containing protein [Ignavibacteria bacterium]
MIEISSVNKVFNPGSFNEVCALEDVSLKIGKSEFVVIIGTNGSGKSTLLNIISGSVLPDSGEIIMNGSNVTDIPDFKRASFISRVFQNPLAGTVSDMSIAENLLIAWSRGKPKYPVIKLSKSLKNYFSERLKSLEMNLENRIDSIMGVLSGGQRQAITLLMAVINPPAVLLLDEHTAALDPKTDFQVSKLTKNFIEQDKLTAVMITHSMQKAVELKKRTIMLHKGKIIDDIPEEEMKFMTSDTLLEKFSDIRKKEKLTADLIEELRKEYF